MRDLLGFLFFATAASAGFLLHARLMRRAGQRRLGRAAAYVVGGICYCVGIGVLASQVNGGWGRGRFMRDAVHTSFPEGLIGGAVVGVLVGLGYFVAAERRRDHTPFPAADVEIVLADEARISRKARAATARRLERRARRSGQSLPPELQAYVERNRLPRRLT